MRVIRVATHSFGGNAFTAFALLSQSHIALHTWPELGYVACDIFSCGGELDPVIRSILEYLHPESVSNHILARGVPTEKKLNTIFVDATGPGIRTVLDASLLLDQKSEFQRIQVFEHATFGRFLALDDDIQFAETDHSIYDDALMSPLKDLDRSSRVLVVGGGDGLCCTYLLQKDIGSRIDVLELDPAVPAVCVKYFKRISGGILDRRVHFVFGDASKSIREVPAGTYDAVVVDTTAPDTKWGFSTYSAHFLSQCKRVLKREGILTMNGTSVWFNYGVGAETIGKAVRSAFGNVRTSKTWIPSFGSPWAFFMAKKKT